MYKKHQQEVHGDFSFFEALLPKSVKVWHMDSYNTKEGKRFQGAFYYDFQQGTKQVPCNEAPLEVLKLATRYQIWTCSCLGGSEQHTTWTIWFD